MHQCAILSLTDESEWDLYYKYTSHASLFELERTTNQTRQTLNTKAKQEPAVIVRTANTPVAHDAVT